MQKIILITPFPDVEEIHAKNTGVGSYSFFLVQELKKRIKVEVWAQKGEELKSFSDENITVKRIWRKGFFSWVDILSTLWSERPEYIHIQHELNIFGGTLAAVFSPLIFLSARILGIEVVTTMHGGFNLSNVDVDFVKENGYSLHPLMIKGAFLFIFGLIAHLSHKVIVHEEWQKEDLFREYFVPKKKVFVIPHGVPDIVELVGNPKEKLKISDRTKVFLYMGFAARYKGLPEMFEIYKDFVFKPENADTLLIIGAGPAPRLEKDKIYMNWYEDLRSKYESLGNKVRWVGFIPSEQISLYYSAADAVVFPYSRRLAASGPMAIAIGYEKDIALSSILMGSKDFEFKFDDILQTNTLKSQRVWSNIADQTLGLYDL